MSKRTIYRSSITGKIVTRKFALDNPDTTEKETIKNAPKAAIKVLKRYSNWRRGAEIKQPDPKEIGEAIDAVIKYFE